MKLYSLLFSLLLGNIVFAQNQEGYFQQKVDYQIKVSLNDVTHELDGNISITYHNQSPDTLSEIYMHLWPNAYHDKHTALACQKIRNRNLDLHFSKDEERGYIDELDFKINGKKVQWSFNENNRDIAIIKLAVPLLPNTIANISTPFHVKIPSGKFSRLGHIGQSYQITQWYPKPAVYDRKGWNAMPYLNQGEFFSEYGNFDVEITLPENYIVGASGNLQTESEKAFLNAKAKEGASLQENFKNWEESKQKEFLKQNNFPPSAQKTKTLYYALRNAHDFAWFADKRYHVLHKEFELFTGKKVQAWSYSTNFEADIWIYSDTYLSRSTQFYSERVGEYPYDVVQAVDGTISAGGGMEYPTITVIGRSNNSKALDQVITHEVGHNWFYGILGSNERQYAWMDEGLNSFYENAYMETYYDNEGLLGVLSKSKIAKAFDLDKYKQSDANEFGILAEMRMGIDQPIGTKSDSLSNINYGLMVYAKTARVLKYLESYLGARIFGIAMQQYYDEWKFKHPYPSDMKTVFERVSRRNLNWFFDDIIDSDLHVNYAISEVQACDTRVAVRVKNKGKVSSPFSLTGIKDGKPSATVWYNGVSDERTVEYLVEDFDEIVLDYEHVMPELDRKNNQYKVNQAFPKIEPIRFQFLTSWENPEKTQIYFSPMIKWNNYNKFIIGSQFNNAGLPFKNFEYSISPEISTYNGSLAGTGFLRYRWNWDKGIFKRIIFGAYGRTYDYQKDLNFKRSSIGVNFFFRRPPISPHNHSLHFRNVILNKELANGDLTSVSNYNITEAKYKYENTHLLHPFKITLGNEFYVPYNKLFAEVWAGYRLKNNKLIELRTFYGQVLGDLPSTSFFAFALDGRNDYLFDFYYFGRSETSGILSNQFFEREGGFKSAYNVNGSKWLIAVNLQVPLWKVFGLYYDFAYMKNVINSNNISTTTQTPYSGYGLQCVVVQDFLELYFGRNDSFDIFTFRYVLNMDLEVMIEALTKGRF